METIAADNEREPIKIMSNPSVSHPPLTGAKLALGSFVVGLAGFMTVLDSSIANVAIPTISGNLGVSADEGTWVITVFAAVLVQKAG